ncbi:MAG TPA: hypothetical protein VMU33_11075 [Burkholderiaceae bacterium]|nr:hypothetical protein [Burkholderiaceae bacterium]
MHAMHDALGARVGRSHPAGDALHSIRRARTPAPAVAAPIRRGRPTPAWTDVAWRLAVALAAGGALITLIALVD